MHLATLASLVALFSSFQLCVGYVAQSRLHDPRCTKTTVAVLGGGMAGVTAAQALSNASMNDFIIVEYRDTLGGRVWHTDFGQRPNGEPWVIEYGANWVQGLGSKHTENPVWSLAKKYQLENTFSNYDSILTYNETGYTDYSDLLDEYSAASERASERAGRILNNNIQDMTARSGLALAGWKPRRDDMAAQAVEWWNWDWEGAYTPETSSFVFGVASENLTFNQFGDKNNLVVDRRGYSAIIQGEANTFLRRNDTRLRLDTQITDIEHGPWGITVRNADGSCISAAYAICTFSLGVLQNDAVDFAPALPDWKQTAIAKFNMGTYTKIFLQFNETFWPNNTQFFLYADPTTRGYYPVFQSLSTEGFLPGSNIIFVTVVQDQAYRVERQSNEQTKAEVMQVLRAMFPHKTIPDPIAFTYPRWSTEPWAYGSYSNWPAGTSLEMHQNLRANVDRLWFAGEATSAPYFGFLHGAYYEGREAGRNVAALLRGECVSIYGVQTCGPRAHYEVLHGTTPSSAYTGSNGWPVNSTSVHA
ncbi:putative flavin containing polyamine oxidase [Aspergillus mulundensis]|uniref:Amine oxidase n=1 Tax=Aspergillus mulundensis TaxID=1810919 RepID=A0A3D8SBT9_9EURO|nr:Amine oxidase [Aspergillus mulundensis]RDW83817.1 Amine oxidase [Aspergillus mulundensis]